MSCEIIDTGGAIAAIDCLCNQKIITRQCYIHGDYID